MGDSWPYIIKFAIGVEKGGMGDFAVSKNMEVFSVGGQQVGGDGMIIQLVIKKTTAVSGRDRVKIENITDFTEGHVEWANTNYVENFRVENGFTIDRDTNERILDNFQQGAIAQYTDGENAEIITAAKTRGEHTATTSGTVEMLGFIFFISSTNDDYDKWVKLPWKTETSLPANGLQMLFFQPDMLSLLDDSKARDSPVYTHQLLVSWDSIGGDPETAINKNKIAIVRGPQFRNILKGLLSQGAYKGGALSTRIRSTRMTAALLRFSKKLHKKLEKSLASDLKVTFEVEDAEDTDGNPSGSTALMIDIEKEGGWGGSNNVFVNGYIGVSGKQGSKMDEAYLDGVQVGDWDKGSSTIGLSGCGIGEFLVLLFTLFAIKANNTRVLLNNAGGDRAQNVYEKVGFYLTKSKEADDEMLVDLAGKKKGQTAGAEWKKRYDAFRKKVGTRLKKCKGFWRDLPPVVAEPAPISMSGARGTHKRKMYKSKRRKRKRGGNATRRTMRAGGRSRHGAVGDMPASVYPAGRTAVREHLTHRAERCLPSSGCSLMGGGKRRTKLTRRERRKRRRRNRSSTRR